MITVSEIFIAYNNENLNQVEFKFFIREFKIQASDMNLLLTDENV